MAMAFLGFMVVWVPAPPLIIIIVGVMMLAVSISCNVAPRRRRHGAESAHVVSSVSAGRVAVAPLSQGSPGASDATQSAHSQARHAPPAISCSRLARRRRRRRHAAGRPRPDRGLAHAKRLVAARDLPRIRRRLRQAGRRHDRRAAEARRAGRRRRWCRRSRWRTRCTPASSTAGMAWPTLWYNKHKASALFATPPSFGWDSHGFLAWFYYGGGEALYQELVNGILKLNLIGLALFPDADAAARLVQEGDRERRRSAAACAIRTAGLAAEVFTALGRDGDEPAQRRDRAGHRARRARCDRVQQPQRPTCSSALPDVAKIYMMGEPSPPGRGVRDRLQQDASSTRCRPSSRRSCGRRRSRPRAISSGMAYARYAKDLDEIKKRGVNVARTEPGAARRRSSKAWDQVIAEHSKEPFFAKVIASQKAWVKAHRPVSAGQQSRQRARLSAAYRHFFG